MHHSSDLASRTVRGFGWALLGTGSLSVARFLMLAILARILSPDDYGLFSAAFIVISFSMLFSELGTGSALIQQSHIEESHIRAAFAMSICIGCLISILLGLTSPLIADFFHNINLSSIIRVLAIVFVIRAGGTVAESLLQRELRYNTITKLDVISYIGAYSLIGVPLAFAGFGVWALVYATIGEALLRTTGLLISRPHAISFRIDIASIQELSQFSIGITFVKLFNYFALQGDYLVVGHRMMLTALGIYTRAFNLMSVPVAFFSQTFSKILFPAMSEVKGQPAKLALAYRRSIAFVALITLPTTAFLIVMAAEFVHVVLGANWTETIIPFQILTISLFFRSAYKVSDALAMAHGALRGMMWRQVVYSALVLLGAWSGSSWGLAGVAAGVSIANLIHYSFMAHLCVGITKLEWTDFLLSQTPGIAVASVLAIVLSSIKSLSYGFHLSEIFLLIFCSCSGLFTILACWYLSPNIFLGKDGEWVIIKLIELSPVRFMNISQRLLGLIVQ